MALQKEQFGEYTEVSLRNRMSSYTAGQKQWFFSLCNSRSHLEKQNPSSFNVCFLSWMASDGTAVEEVSGGPHKHAKHQLCEDQCVSLLKKKGQRVTLTQGDFCFCAIKKIKREEQLYWSLNWQTSWMVVTLLNHDWGPPDTQEHRRQETCTPVQRFLLRHLLSKPLFLLHLCWEKGLQSTLTWE